MEEVVLVICLKEVAVTVVLFKGREDFLANYLREIVVIVSHIVIIKVISEEIVVKYWIVLGLNIEDSNIMIMLKNSKIY